jgi:hypothetical protein
VLQGQFCLICIQLWHFQVSSDVEFYVVSRDFVTSGLIVSCIVLASFEGHSSVFSSLMAGQQE